MNSTEASTDVGEALLKDLLSSLFIDTLGELIHFAGLVLVLIAVVRLYRAARVPGVNYLFYSMVLTVVGSIVAIIMAGDEESWLFDTIFSIYTGLVFLLGAFGFWKLANHLIDSSAGK